MNDWGRVSKVCQGCFKEDWGVFLYTFKGDSRLSKISSKCVSREFEGSFKDVLRKFQGCLKKVSSVFLALTLPKIQNFNMRSLFSKFKNFSRVFKESVKCVSRKFHKKLLHGSHRSYPSRRRACFLKKKSSPCFFIWTAWW